MSGTNLKIKTIKCVCCGRLTSYTKGGRQKYCPDCRLFITPLKTRMNRMKAQIKYYKERWTQEKN